MNHTYKIIIHERQSDDSIRILTRTAVCRSVQEVIDWYGLTEPDIVHYYIEEEK